MKLESMGLQNHKQNLERDWDLYKIYAEKLDK